jgi:argininosuccinate lyase
MASLTPDAAVRTRDGYGGTAPLRVAEQLVRLRSDFDTQREWAMRYDGPQI